MPITVDAALLRRFAPKAAPGMVEAILDLWDEAVAAGLTTDKRIVAFFGEIATESAGLSRLEENLRYSANRLCQVWPSRFPSAAAARPFANNPERLANKVYGGRMGNTQPGDGWLFRGRALLQTTGRAGYRSAGFEDNPDALAEPENAFRAALHEWTKRGCNRLADRGDFLGIRKAINLGSATAKGKPLGLAEAATYRARFSKCAAAAQGGALGLISAPAATDGADADDDAQARPVEAAIDDPLDDLDDAADCGPTAGRLAGYQARLRALGYVEVGNPTGRADDAFAKAALVAFQHDREIPETGAFDATTLDEMAEAEGEGWKRPIAESRANASAKEIAQVVPEAGLAGLQKKILGGLGLGAGGLSLGDASGYVAQAKAMFADVPSWVWLLGAAAIAGVLYLNAQRAQHAANEAYRAGARR